MIIVEGADNCGKSTLIKRMLEMDKNLRILHRDRFRPSKPGDSIGLSYLKALIPPDGDRLRHAWSVADRFLASEDIYGELFRGGTRVRPGERLAIRLMLHSYKALIVHCDPGDPAILASWQKREQLYDDPTLITKTYRKMLRASFGSGLPIVQYDWTNDPDGRRIQLLLKSHEDHFREHEQVGLSWWSALPYGAGQLEHCDVVIIGESPSPRAQVPVPFSAGPAGDFLAWTIEQAEEESGSTITDRIYVTNADKGTGRDASVLREELNALRPKIALALGREASQMLDYLRPTVSSATEFREIPHPQFWRRFHFKRRNQYVRKFLESLYPAVEF